MQQDEKRLTRLIDGLSRIIAQQKARPPKPEAKPRAPAERPAGSGGQTPGIDNDKTPDAGLVGQGLSGTIDMRTIRPLSYDGSAVMVSGRWQRNSLGSAANQGATGNRFNASYIGQSASFDQRKYLGSNVEYSHYCCG